jgi:hypothetical protein
MVKLIGSKQKWRNILSIQAKVDAPKEVVHDEHGSRWRCFGCNLCGYKYLNLVDETESVKR